MTIELTLLLGMLSASAALYFGIAAKRRNECADARKDSADRTTVVVKLENIISGVNEIKADMRSMRADVNETRERLIAVEQSAKQAHKRLDDLSAVLRREGSEA